MKITGTIILLMATLILPACSPYYSPYKNQETDLTIYELEIKQASELAHKAIEDIVPSKTIGEMQNGTGYFATERLLIDEQTYSIKLVPFTGEAKDRKVDGFSFDVYSDGTLFHGPHTTRKLLEHTINLFDQTGRGVLVKNISPRELKVDTKNKFDKNETIDQKLIKIKQLFENNLISENEYSAKKAKLLSEY